MKCLSYTVALAALLTSCAAQAQTCTATTPYQPPAQYCVARSDGLCAATPTAAANRQLSERASTVPPVYPGFYPGMSYIGCGCFEANGRYICPYMAKYPDGHLAARCDQGGYSYALAVDAACGAGAERIESGPSAGKCMDGGTAAQERAAVDHGALYVRDEHGNALSYQQPAGVTKWTAGEYDAHGRPGFIAESGLPNLNITWPQDSSSGLPLSLSIPGYQPALFHWDAIDFLLPDQIDVGANQYRFTYWPNDSVRYLSRGTQVIASYSASGARGPVGVPLPTPHTSAATLAPAGPAPTLGVRQITVNPGGGLFALGTVTAGAALVWPSPSGSLLDRIINWCFPASEATPEAIRACNLQYVEDLNKCEQLLAASKLPSDRKTQAWVQCKLSAEVRFRACRNRITHPDIPLPDLDTSWF